MVVEVDGDDVWQGDAQGSLFHWRVPRSAARQKQRPTTIYASKTTAPPTTSALTLARADSKKEDETAPQSTNALGKDKKLLPVQSMCCVCLFFFLSIGHVR